MLGLALSFALGDEALFLLGGGLKSVDGKVPNLLAEGAPVGVAILAGLARAQPTIEVAACVVRGLLAIPSGGN